MPTSPGRLDPRDPRAGARARLRRCTAPRRVGVHVRRRRPPSATGTYRTTASCSRSARSATSSSLRKMTSPAPITTMWSTRWRATSSCTATRRTLPGRGVAAGGARGTCGRARVRGARAHRSRRRLRLASSSRTRRRRSACGDHWHRDHARRRRAHHAARRIAARVCEPLPPAHGRARGNARRHRRGEIQLALRRPYRSSRRRANDGLVCSLRLRASRSRASIPTRQRASRLIRP